MKKILLAIVLSIALFSTPQAQSLDLKYEDDGSNYKYYIQPVSLRWANDSWVSRDKLDHFIAGFGTMAASSLVWSPDTDNDVWRFSGKNVLFWTVWEVKDAIMPWEFWGRIGGDGFSYKDATWSAAGVGLATVLVFLVK